jgi:hypothetical protein
MGQEGAATSRVKEENLMEVVRKRVWCLLRKIRKANSPLRLKLFREEINLR